MSIVVLRPEPGNARTIARLRVRGIDARSLPLFAIAPVAWDPPDPTGYDALLLTSANAVRHGGAGLAWLTSLPVVAVGDATADAARAAGFTVEIVGSGDAQAAIGLARARGFARLLHLAGRERTTDGAAITVYTSDPLPIAAADIRACEDATVLLHSPRAARVFVERVDNAGADRARIALAAISPAAADAAGPGWRSVVIAPAPDDDALVAVAATPPIDRDARGGDKRIMSDTVPIERPQARGPRLGIIMLLIVLAFAAGIALMAYAIRHWGWFGATTQAAIATAPKTQAGDPNYTPSLPLNANGESPAPVDTTVLATREAALAGQLTVLEARTAAVTTDAAAAANQATRAEGLMVAFAARRAIDRGVGLGYLEEQLRQRFGQGQPRATAIVLQAARQPVTLEDLRQGLDAIAPDITSANSATATDWIQTVRREFDNLIVLRDENLPSPMPADRLARARRLLESGQVEAARAEVARLPGATQATNWLDAARRYVLVRQALDAIESAALMPPPQPTPVVVTAPVIPPAVTTTP